MAALIELDKQLEYPSCKKKFKEQAKKEKDIQQQIKRKVSKTGL